MRVVQCSFRCQDGEEKSVWTTAWVDASWRLKVGMRISFKDDPRVWDVMQVGNGLMDVSEINTVWTVGGNTEVTARKEK